MAALLALMLFAPPTDARAQNIISDFFGGLFGGGGRNPHIIERSWPAQRRPRESAPMRRIVPHSTSREPTYWRPPRHADREDAASATRRSTVANHGETPPVEADFFVVVMGDTLGDMLADGLEEAFEDFPEIGVLHKGKESSGLVRNDFYDWPKTALEIANGPRKPDVAVMMLGSNDHQALGDGAQAVGAFLAALARGLYGPGGGRYPRLQGKGHSARLGGAPDDESGAIFGRYGANQRNLSRQRGQAPAFPSSTSGTSSPTITVSTAPSAPT